MNKVILTGRLGADAEIQNFGEHTKTTFTVATSENYKNASGEWEQKTDWHLCELWRERNISKGALITVEGQLKTDSWEKDGQKFYKTYVRVQKIEVHQKGHEQEGTLGTPKRAPGFINDDEIPF